jgi:hypothetical protein
MVLIFVERHGDEHDGQRAWGIDMRVPEGAKNIRIIRHFCFSVELPREPARLNYLANQRSPVEV